MGLVGWIGLVTCESLLADLVLVGCLEVDSGLVEMTLSDRLESLCIFFEDCFFGSDCLLRRDIMFIFSVLKLGSLSFIIKY